MLARHSRELVATGGHYGHQARVERCLGCASKAYQLWVKASTGWELVSFFSDPTAIWGFTRKKEVLGISKSNRSLAEEAVPKEEAGGAHHRPKKED